MSIEPNKWVPIVDALIFQTYYRTLGMVSIHGPITEIYDACQYLQETKRKGNLYWVIPKKIANWEDLIVSEGITQTIRIFGSELRGKNTVLMRKGFFTSYLIDVPDIMIHSLGLLFGTYKPPLR